MTRLALQRAMGCRATVFGRLAKTPTLLTLMGKGLIWLERTKHSTNINFMEVMSMEVKLKNISEDMLASGGYNVALYCHYIIVNEVEEIVFTVSPALVIDRTISWGRQKVPIQLLWEE